MLLELSYALCMPAYMQPHYMQLFGVQCFDSAANKLHGMLAVHKADCCSRHPVGPTSLTRSVPSTTRMDTSPFSDMLHVPEGHCN